MNVKCRIRILKPKTCVHTYAGLKPETSIQQIVVLLYFTVQNQNLIKMRPTEQQLQLRQTDQHKHTFIRQYVNKYASYVGS